MKTLFTRRVASLYLWAAFLGVMILLGVNAASAMAKSHHSSETIPGQYIVVFKDDVQGNDVGALAQSLANGKGSVTHTYTKALKGFSIAGLPAQAVEGITHNPNVAYVVPDGTVHAEAEQDSPPWGLNRIDQRSSNLDDIYAYTETGLEVKVYVVDTGIQYAHLDFEDRTVDGFDAFGAYGEDCNGHGTHVAGTIGGATYGVAKGVQLVSVRVLNCEGSGEWSDVIAGLEWILGNAQGPSVANIALTGGANQAVDDAVRALYNAGIVPVISAGNDTVNACLVSPGRVPEAITVGATDSDDSRASFSNYGPCIDWFAPGVDILSTYVGAGDENTTTLSGTSMAAAHTAGAAALFLERAPTATPQEVRDALFAQATKGVVGNALSDNFHLLYTLADQDNSNPPPPVNNPPVVTFSWSCTNLACAFTDQSIDDGLVNGWAWNFGDGTATSSVQNPHHSFALVGTYAVTLTVTDNAGVSNASTTNVAVTAPNTAPVAKFSKSCTNLSCGFTDQSTDDGAIASWAWTFGDGATANTQNPSHAYATAGTYPVTLTVTDNVGASNATTTNVTVTAPNTPPVAKFSKSCTNLSCSFTDQSTDDGTIVSWAWTFGDGTATSTLRNPYHNFAQAGSYLVRLLVTDNLGASNASTTSVTVTTPPPVINLTAAIVKTKPETWISLTWSGARTATVDIYRNNGKLTTVSNSGNYVDNRGKGTYVAYPYKVCEVNTTICSPSVYPQ